MGNLPDSRTETPVPGAKVGSNLMGEIEDCIIAGVGFKPGIGDRHSARSLSIMGSSFNGTAGTFPNYDVAGKASLTGGGAGLVCALALRAGSRITSASFVGQDSAIPLTKIRAHIKGVDSTGATVSDDVSVDSTGSGLIQTVNFTGLGSGRTLVAGIGYFLQINYGSGTGSLILVKFDLVYDRPV